MTIPRREPKKGRAIKSNKLKRVELQARREAKRKKRDQARSPKTPGSGAAYDEGLPPGAVVADLKAQVPNNSYSAKPLYYVDQPFTCRDCGREEVWTATQQKWYYEVAKGSLYGSAVRCRACRRRRRGLQGPVRQSAD
jgi:hypothetical protein